MTILCFSTNLSSIINLGTIFLEGGRVVTPWCYCSSYSISTVPLQYWQSVCYSINLIQWRWCFLLMELDHLKSIGKFEFTPLHYGPLSLVWNLSELIGAELDHTSKRESVSHNLFYKCVKLQKFWMLGGIYLKGLNRAILTQFQQRCPVFT
jgi:hypothetical protein